MKSLFITAALLTVPATCLAERFVADAEPDTAPVAGPARQADQPDMLRFSNNDTLHGNFLSFGKDGTMLWKNPEVKEPIHFSTQKIHRIILNHGQGHQSTGQSSTVTLVNGDVIPGSITSANQKSVILKTDHLGTITLPRDTVSRIAPTPFGGKLLYYGPLNTNGWKTMLPPETKKTDEKAEEKKPLVKIEDQQEDQQEDQEEDEAQEEKDTNADWKHIASAWYSGTDKNRYLTRMDALPDNCRLAFKLGWRGSLYCNIAIHADFDPPVNKGKENDKAQGNIQGNMATTVGHAYVVSLSTHSSSLYACSFDKDGNPTSTRIDTDGNRVSLGLSGKEEADFEFRIDRPNKQLLLYLDGNFKTKWDLGDDYAGTGNHLSFRNLRYSNAELRVSDIIISRWNGLKDSAQSMQTPDRDVILLTNGVDRFSGKLNHILDGKVSFRGSYNNDFSIPVDEVQEIHLASNNLRKMPEDVDDKSTYFYIHPYGRISGMPSPGDINSTKLNSNLLGELSLNTRYVNIIDFSHQNSLLDLWDDNF